MTRRYIKVQEGYQAEFPGVSATKIIEGPANQVSKFSEEDFYETGAKKNKAIKCRIRVMGKDILEARHVDPDRSTGFGYLQKEGDEFWLYGQEEISAFRWVNDKPNQPTKLIVTMYYLR